MFYFPGKTAESANAVEQPVRVDDVTKNGTDQEADDGGEQGGESTKLMAYSFFKLSPYLPHKTIANSARKLFSS